MALERTRTRKGYKWTRCEGGSFRWNQLDYLVVVEVTSFVWCCLVGLKNDLLNCEKHKQVVCNIYWAKPNNATIKSANVQYLTCQNITLFTNKESKCAISNGGTSNVVHKIKSMQYLMC